MYQIFNDIDGLGIACRPIICKMSRFRHIWKTFIKVVDKTLKIKVIVLEI